MRLLFGIIIGGFLTIGGAYLYDSSNAMSAVNEPANAQRSLVNWDVVGTKWQLLTQRARAEWNHLAG